ncbi:hypothetical protein PG994_010344 [Apiospora phragmitis]|uniref:Uncharacterized protein n=1 Tax=Apiospora phragmitis TaxID=2905665 RepID=A0ABR1TPM6_9PEZI
MNHRVEYCKDKANHLVAEEGDPVPSLGIFPVFYEASIQSTKAKRAFAENKTLEFAEETEWTGKGLKEAEVFKDLVSSATDLVKQMDSIGYWCDNQQKTEPHGRPPFSTAEVGEREGRLDATQHSFW